MVDFDQAPPLGHSLSHILQIFHSFLKKLALILMFFATHFQSYRLKGQIWAPPEYLGLTNFEKNWLASLGNVIEQSIQRM